MEVPLEKLINMDNHALLLHKREFSDYLKGKRNRLITIEVDLTLACNHRCPNCTFASQLYNNRVSLDDDILDKILKGLTVIGPKGMIITGGGEPCIHEGLGGFVRKVSESGIDVTLTTNGQLIHRHFQDLMHNLKRIRFSIDGASSRTFKYTHGMNGTAFGQVIDNLKNAVQYKKKRKLAIDIGVSFLICEANAFEMAEAIDFYKKIGVNFLHFKPMQFWDKTLNRYYYKDSSIAKKIFSKIGTYKENNFKVTISRENYYKEYRPNVAYHKCHGAYFDMIIGADSKVYACCHFKYNPKYCYGDLAKENLKDILNNRIKSDITNECFADCKMDALNQFVEFARSHQRETLRIAKNLSLKDLPLGSKWL